nr:uncharacterized protein LOC116426561 isoform X1 [Nomia melanderi]
MICQNRSVTVAIATRLGIASGFKLVSSRRTSYFRIICVTSSQSASIINQWSVPRKRTVPNSFSSALPTATWEIYTAPPGSMLYNLLFYFRAAAGLIFFLEITWAVTLFVQICVRNDESLCFCCWSGVLAITNGWRRALFYLPLSCALAWKPHNLWLSYVAAGLLAALSLLHIVSSALEDRALACQMNNADSVAESLLNTRSEHYDRFEEVLVTEVMDDGMTGPAGRMDNNDGEM